MIELKDKRKQLKKTIKIENLDDKEYFNYYNLSILLITRKVYIY